MLFLCRNSSSHHIFSLNLMTSSMMIIHHSIVLFHIVRRKSILDFIIPSINTKSNQLSSEGIISKAFPKWSSTLFSNWACLTFSFAISREGLEKSILVTFPPFFSAAIAKWMVENQFAVQISKIFFAEDIQIRSLRKEAFVSEIFGTLFCVQNSLNSFNKVCLSVLTNTFIIFIIYYFLLMAWVYKKTLVLQN